jgi:hypothetical protein
MRVRLIVAMLVLSSALWGADPLLGRWKSASGNITDTWSEESGGMIRWTREEIKSNGQVLHIEALLKFDGVDYSVTGSSTVDAMAARRLDDHTFETTTKRQGKVVFTAKNAISSDGKTLTNTRTGTDEKGRPVSSSYVLTKQ